MESSSLNSFICQCFTLCKFLSIRDVLRCFASLEWQFVITFCSVKCQSSCFPYITTSIYKWRICYSRRRYIIEVLGARNVREAKADIVRKVIALYCLAFDNPSIDTLWSLFLYSEWWFIWVESLVAYLRKAGWLGLAQGCDRLISCILPLCCVVVFVL